MSQITTHILDTTQGKPAAGVIIILLEQRNGGWQKISTGKTNDDGRIPDLLPQEEVLPTGIYKLKFETKPYFDSLGIKSFYPFVEVVFELNDLAHYHVPLLLNPYGYSTYKGS